MIQRIQTIYLLLTAALMALAVFCPLLEFSNGDKFALTFLSCGIYQMLTPLMQTWGVVTIAGLGSLLAFINIFLYKKRKLQIKLAYTTSLLAVLFYITAGVYFYAFMAKSEATIEVTGIYAIIAPAIALIFNILATSKIKKDEKLVRSLDRIR